MTSAHRLLIVDDNPAIHEDFRKVLAVPDAAELTAGAAKLLGEPAPLAVTPYEIEFADQGREALAKVCQAVEIGRPFSLAFVDARMPPGWDGVETVARIWEKDRHIQMAICTAYSDYSWREILQRLGLSDGLLVLKKPFDPVEVCQLACAMTRKWSLARQAELKTAELERLVRQRTAHLQRINDELQRKNRPLYKFCELEVERNHLRDSVQAMEQVLGIIGHELRTPLGCIRGLSEMMLKTVGAADQAAAGMLTNIAKTAREMAATLNSLLEAARLNSGHASFNWSSFSLEQLCREALQVLRPVAGEGKVPLNVSIDPLSLTMKGDPDAIKRLLLNLLNNAERYTSTGAISVGVRQIAEAELKWVELTVADTGAGIGPEIMQRLGEPFAVNRGVVGERYVHGAGLGIAICKSIAHAHGGFVEIQSALGKGTTVTIRLRQDLTEPARTGKAVVGL